MIEDEVPRYKKKSQKKPPAKAKHKHEYTNCVFGFNGMRFSKERGFEPEPDVTIGTYCPICGKIGGTFDNAEVWIVDKRLGPHCLTYEWTDAAKREFNATTRTLPYFWLGDRWLAKYVNLEDKE